MARNMRRSTTLAKAVANNTHVKKTPAKAAPLTKIGNKNAPKKTNTEKATKPKVVELPIQGKNESKSPVTSNGNKAKPVSKRAPSTRILNNAKVASAKAALSTKPEVNKVNKKNVTDTVQTTRAVNTRKTTSTNNKSPVLRKVNTGRVEKIALTPLQSMSSAIQFGDGRSRNAMTNGKHQYRIPPHLLGRNLRDPSSDTVDGSGRPLQKPRLGVKIPYRNLTSQIISHEELTRELLERSKRKNSGNEDNGDGSSDGSNGYVFTMKLMARLAHRLPNPPIPPPLVKRPVKTESSPLNSLGYKRPGCSLDPELEREIALKQLEELPTKRKAPVAEVTNAKKKKKKQAGKSEPLTPQQVALKQLEEIQIRKPRTSFIKKQSQTSSVRKSKFKGTQTSASNSATQAKLAPIKITQLCKTYATKKKTVSNSQSGSASRKKALEEMPKTRFSSRLKH